MSDVKIIDGDDTAEFQLDAAQSELAALREELDSARADKEAYAQNAIDLRASLGKANALHTALVQGGNLVADRLTAAEQRNSVMSKLLQRCIPVCRYKGSHTERALINEIETALTQPTESGASE